MSMAAVRQRFKDEVGSGVALKGATMAYEDGGAMQVFSFECVVNRGVEAKIDVRCPAGGNIFAAASEAAKIATKMAKNP